MSYDLSTCFFFSFMTDLFFDICVILVIKKIVIMLCSIFWHISVRHIYDLIFLCTVCHQLQKCLSSRTLDSGRQIYFIYHLQYASSVVVSFSVLWSVGFVSDLLIWLNHFHVIVLGQWFIFSQKILAGLKEVLLG